MAYGTTTIDWRGRSAKQKLNRDRQQFKEIEEKSNQGNIISGIAYGTVTIEAKGEISY